MLNIIKIKAITGRELSDQLSFGGGHPVLAGLAIPRSNSCPFNHLSNMSIINSFFLQSSYRAWKWRPMRTWFRNVYYYQITIGGLDIRDAARKDLREVELEIQSTFDCCIFGSRIDELHLMENIFDVKINVRFHNEEEVALLILQYG